MKSRTKPDISVATVFGEEIEKQWRNHVPRECVFQLRLMAEQLMNMEKLIQTQQGMIERLMHFAVVEGKALQYLKQQQKEIDRYRESMATSEHLIDDE